MSNLKSYSSSRRTGRRQTGLYLAVLREEEIEAGDAMELLSRDENGVSVADIIRLYAFDKLDLKILRRALLGGALPESWRRYFRRKIERLSE